MPNGNKHPYSKSSKILPHTKQILMFTDGINDKIRTEINKLFKMYRILKPLKLLLVVLLR